jgi:hypothetical protein
MVVQKTVNRWTGNELSRAGYLQALEPNSDAARKDLETMLLGLPHFEVYATADTNTSSTILDLTALGVTFPDKTSRFITTRAFVADNDGQGIIESKSVVDGGTTPILVTDTADSDLLVSGLSATPTLVPTMAGNSVTLVAVGLSGVPTRWVVQVFVGDAIPLAYNP